MTEFDLNTAKHNPIIEEIVDVLCNKTQNTDRNFFRAEVAFFIGKMASNMRASVVTKDRGDIRGTGPHDCHARQQEDPGLDERAEGNLQQRPGNHKENPSKWTGALGLRPQLPSL